MRKQRKTVFYISVENSQFQICHRQVVGPNVIVAVIAFGYSLSRSRANRIARMICTECNSKLEGKGIYYE